MSVSIAHKSADAKAGWLAADDDTGVPFGLPPGDESHGCTAGFADADAPEDKGSSEPQDLPGIEHFDMAALKDTLRRTAARIERECGGKCKCEAVVSSEDNGTSGFLVWLSLDGGSLNGGETFMGNAGDLDAAELQARLKASVWVVEQRKAAAAVGVAL